jgi:hypothetical protein
MWLALHQQEAVVLLPLTERQASYLQMGLRLGISIL